MRKSEYTRRRKGAKKAKRSELDRRALVAVTEAMDDERAIREGLGMAIPKEIVESANILREADEMTDDEYRLIVKKGPPLVDKDAKTERLSHVACTKRCCD
jgi:hypothetical protein